MDTREEYEHQRALVTVGGLVVAPDGELLIVKSHKWSDTYTVPGGKVEFGETLEHAFKREIREETGLEIVDIQFAQIVESIFSKEFWKKNAHFVMHDYIGKLAPGCRKSDVVLNDEAQSYVWSPPQDALNLNLSQETVLLIQWYLSHVRNSRF
jgi:ADP-ribose pyrophosphatase YjhB (NUDIX family)